MKSSELDYALPAELIAQHPLERRDHSRLLVYDRATGETWHRRFDDLPDELADGTLVVVNDTRVLPARLRLQGPGGGGAAGLPLRRRGGDGGGGGEGGGPRAAPPQAPPGPAAGAGRAAGAARRGPVAPAPRGRARRRGA